MSCLSAMLFWKRGNKVISLTRYSWQPEWITVTVRYDDSRTLFFLPMLLSSILPWLQAICHGVICILGLNNINQCKNNPNLNYGGGSTKTPIVYIYLNSILSHLYWALTLLKYWPNRVLNTLIALQLFKILNHWQLFLLIRK